MISFEQLLAEHRDAATHAAALERAVRIAQPGTVIAAAIAALDHRLAPHLETEDQLIYPLLLESRDEGERIAASHAIEAWSALAADWTGFAARWTPSAIEADRPTLAAELATLLAALAGRIKAENDVLYPIALRGAHIRLRAA
ncbi:hemerythrin domain-containing protein [Sphingomonas sp. MG17]|uniref:Hemerythrin domain-containing protein n=1 Tax=Sphingomonas tagetis TaxID=2949092 RepID=A0A9X2HJK0_9SPHN|nr:hemerythrin domain-containing protein [Sphingomonas tagetis]MCP3732376.1 hemerythrin domain-containing protein [Sphingomonas tagetis]